VRTPSDNAISRFQRIALAAIKQCDNPWLPDIQAPLAVTSSLVHICEAGFSPVICSEQRPEIRIQDLELATPCFVIGPEGGFSEAEFEFFRQQRIPQLSICSLITRAETAAIAIAAQFAGLVS